MSGSKGTEGAVTVMSRREMIVGALALAAGTLVASPGVALAADPNPIYIAQDNLCVGTTKVIRKATMESAEIQTIAYFNHLQDEPAGSPVTYQALMGAVHSGATPSSVGVLGWADSADHVAMGAINEDTAGIALYAAGKVVLSRSGKVTIGKGHSGATVTVASGVETTAMILVTPQSDAGGGVYVKYAARRNATSFTIALTKKTTKAAKFAWMILG